MVDAADLSFKPVYHHPEHMAGEIQTEVDYMINGGYFAWAIRERRGVVISSEDHSRQYLLHVIANHNQVKGMFGGLLPDGQTTLPDTAMTLLSIILLHVANAAESMAYTNLLMNQSRLLERQVAERTRALTQSQQELQAAMQRTRAMAETAQAASRAKGDFLAKMSHELRTPLNGIIGMTEVALSAIQDENQQHIIQIIARESFSLLRQINDVLDFSKIESGLRQVMEEIGETVAFQAHEKGLDLNVFVDPSIPEKIEGDPVRLRQILLNLAGNAMKFTHTGEILIEARLEHAAADDSRIRFSVVDTGIGIEPGKLADIFSSFTQADNSTTRQYGGTGLGTTISKQLVELMGGEIGVDSQPGLGSTFWFRAEFTAISSGPSPQTGILYGETGTALVVDANANTRRILSAYLNELGFRAETAVDGRAALASLESWCLPEKPIRAVVTSEHLGDMTAEALKADIRRIAHCAKIPVIVAASMRTMVVSGENAGDDVVVIAKPVKLEDLEAALLKTIRRRTVSPSDPISLSLDHTDATVVPSSACKGRVLVVDDYATNREVASIHLAAAGYQVDAVVNGQQAAEAFRSHPYDLVLMDVQMPVLNGLDATRLLREMEQKMGRRRRVLIIALTANALKGEEDKYMAAGMDGYLTKPVHRHLLIKSVDQWIRTRSYPERFDASPKTAVPEGVDIDNPPVMDTVTAVDEFGGWETVKTVAGQLIGNVMRQLQQIRESLANGDRESVRREAHAIKGGAATLEATALSKAAAYLERQSPHGRMEELEAGLGNLENQFYRFRDFVSQWKG